MKNARLFWSCLLLCLPTVLVVSLSGYFYADKVPEIEKAERDRVRAEYREVALAIRQDPDDYFVWKDFRESQKLRPDIWKAAGKMKPGKWGFAVDTEYGETTCVWYDNGVEVRSKDVPIIPESDYRLQFQLIGSLFLLVLVGVTIAGIRYFVRYVKSRDDFLAATAHDLTTPLVGMRMMIGRCDDEAKRLNERMLLIVSNIKDFMKLGGRRKKPELKPVDIVALTKEAYQLFAADYEDSEGGEVEFGHGGDGEGTVVTQAIADETMVLQILWNLFGNDLKYAAPYGKVAVRFAQEGQFVQVEFVDAGQGMTPRQMKRAFDRYYRARTVLQSGKGGFGIGLCTAREFARAMGGDLAVRPNDPRGCVFTLSLPLCST